MRFAPFIIRVVSVLVLGMFSAWLGADVAHAQAVDWRYYGILPACNNPCGEGIGVKCEYPGDQGTYQYAYYTLNGVIELMVNIMRWIFSVTGALALLMFVWGGFQLLISRGEASTIKEGKQTIQNALIGIFLIFGGWMIVNFLVSSLISTGTDTLETTKRLTGGIELWKYDNKDVCKIPNLIAQDAKNLSAGSASTGTGILSCSERPPLIFRTIPKSASKDCKATCDTNPAKNARWTTEQFSEMDKHDKCCCYYKIDVDEVRLCAEGCRATEYCEGPASSGQCKALKANGVDCRASLECQSKICGDGKCIATDAPEAEGVCCVERFISNDQPHNYEQNSSTTRLNCEATLSTQRLSIKFCPKNTSCALADAGGCETLK